MRSGLGPAPEPGRRRLSIHPADPVGARSDERPSFVSWRTCVPDIGGRAEQQPHNERSSRLADSKRSQFSATLAGNSTSAAADADALIERIEHAIGRSASQRDALEQLRAALVQAVERINATCPALVPATFTERLNAIQDRIWIMHDALLTLRLQVGEALASSYDCQWSAQSVQDWLTIEPAQYHGAETR